MTAQEAFEAFADENAHNLPDELDFNLAQAAWQAALAWLRSQQKPVGYTGKCASNGHFCLHPHPHRDGGCAPALHPSRTDPRRVATRAERADARDYRRDDRHDACAERISFSEGICGSPCRCTTTGEMK